MWLYSTLLNSLRDLKACFPTQVDQMCFFLLCTLVDIWCFLTLEFKILHWKCPNHLLFLEYNTEFFKKYIEIGTEPPREIVAKFNPRKV